MIVTNAHVAGRVEAEIVLSDGRSFAGRVERRDARRDLALIRIDARGLPAATVRDPAEVRVGEVLVAVGHPLGIPNALTMGIAHAAVGDGPRRFVQADLRLAPGNSGGPLADVHGRVVGINSMVAGGLALAVPPTTCSVSRGRDRAGAPRRSPRAGSAAWWSCCAARRRDRAGQPRGTGRTDRRRRSARPRRRPPALRTGARRGARRHGDRRAGTGRRGARARRLIARA